MKITAITNNRFTDMGHILYDENIHGEFDKLLGPFADVRGLGEVFFTGKPWVREWCGMEGCYPVGTAEQMARLKGITEGPRCEGKGEER